MLASFHASGTEHNSQALVISWCSLLNKLSPPCFHTSAGIPSPPGVIVQAGDCSALRDVVQSFVIYVARDVE